MFEEFYEPVTLTLAVPEHSSQELANKRASLGPRASKHLAVLALATSEIKNISGFAGGYRSNGDGYIELTVRPTNRYTLGDAERTLRDLAVRINGSRSETLAREWAALPEERRTRCKIVRTEDVQAA